MQTFLPYANFYDSAKCLDYRRLGKQRVEVLQILNALTNPKKGWKNHPATKMWAGYEGLLSDYGITICEEWINRNYKDTCLDKIFNIVKPTKSPCPSWLGDKKFHDSHKSMLIQKQPDHYLQFNWDVPHDLQYIWPV